MDMFEFLTENLKKPIEEYKEVKNAKYKCYNGLGFMIDDNYQDLLKTRKQWESIGKRLAVKEMNKMKLSANVNPLTHSIAWCESRNCYRLSFGVKIGNGKG